MRTYALTCGDVNGIGPEIILKTLNKIAPTKNRRLIVLCPKNVFEQTTSIIPPKFSYSLVKTIPSEWASFDVQILDIGNCKQSIGNVTKSAGAKSYNAIITACKLAKEGIVDSIITAPISKLAFKKAEIEFPGHTELLAKYFNINKFSMMFVSNKMKAGLVTIHIPIKHVSKSLSKSKIKNTIEVILNSLKQDFGIIDPKIALLGLNPHAGEEGKIGNEEIKIIEPILAQYNNYVTGPFVPDAYFGNRVFEKFDCTIGLYHDQILIPFKLLNFNRGVNYTAGLPIVRTSPDHGTAFDIAGMGIANPDSMIEALKYAEIIVKNRQRNN